MTGLVCSSLISLSYYWFYSILILILLNHFIPGVHDLRLPEHAAKRNVIYSRLQRIMDMNRTSHEYTFDTRCINHLVHVNLKWSRNLTSFCHSFFSLFFLPLLICSKFFSWRVNINIYFAIWAIGLMVLWSKLFLLVYLPVLFRLCDYLTFVNHDWKSRESKKKKYMAFSMPILTHSKQVKCFIVFLLYKTAFIWIFLRKNKTKHKCLKK